MHSLSLSLCVCVCVCVWCPVLSVSVLNDRFKGYMTSDSDSCSDLPAGHPKGEDHIPATPTNGTDATRQVGVPPTFSSIPDYF
eukprot:COSAG05_NODE_752_length_7532_cov_44.503565_7_plen_83_part_00